MLVDRGINPAEIPITSALNYLLNVQEFKQLAAEEQAENTDDSGGRWYE